MMQQRARLLRTYDAKVLELFLSPGHRNDKHRDRNGAADRGLVSA